MYTGFFGLHEKPFSITPDPRYLYMSERHGEALAHLVYGVTESGGFIQLTGEVGTGKTTLVRTLLLNRMPDNADVAVVLNPQLSVVEFLATICEELHIDVPHNRGSVKALTDALNRHLLAAHAEGRRTILVVDEAQNLAPAVLEQVRLLTNLETAKQKLLQIILIGQPELRELLARNDLRQLAQRITGRYHLEPLTREETAQYIEHRLRVAGALGEVFDAGAKSAVYKLSGGVPRLINVICDRALLGAYSTESRNVSARIVRRAAAEVSGDLEKRRSLGPLAAVAAGLAAVVVAVGTWSNFRTAPAIDTAAPAAATIAPAAIAEAQPGGSAEAVPVADDLPVAIEEPQPTLDEALALSGELTTSDFAMATLFRLWGLEYTTGPRSACDQAADAGLACLAQRGSWRALKQMDRPAVLRLVASDGSDHSVVVTAINGEQAELSIGGVTISQPVSVITDAWFGQSLLLWKPAYAGAPVSLAPGVTANEVRWLRDSLVDIDTRYASSAPASPTYDAELADIVRAFQRDNQLNVDGLAGKQTQLIINSRLGIDGTPRLTTPRLAKD